MDADRFFRGSTVLIVAGKGGVGKTTTTAAIGLAAARRGLDVCLFSLGDPHGLPALFDVETPLSSDGVTLYEHPDGGRVRARVLEPDAILLEYLIDHSFGRIAKRLGDSGVLDVVATAVPGVREVLVLGKVKQLEQRGDADLFVLDAPASGHALRFLTSAEGLRDAARSGPLRVQADAASDLLGDPDRSRLLLVTIPEETPVNEAVETAYRVEDEVGIALGPIIVNDCLPVLGDLDVDPLVAARSAGIALDAETASRLGATASLRLGRQQLQAAQLDRLRSELPLAQIVLPHLFEPTLDLAALEVLADALDAGAALLE